MNNTIIRFPEITNEPVKHYKKGSDERTRLESELKRQMAVSVDIPLIINGKEVWTDQRKDVIGPHDHSIRLGTFCLAGPAEVSQAIEAALKAKSSWETMPWQERALIFLKAADLISKEYTYLLNAATMLGQSKNVHQAEIDSTCELADFFRFNVKFMQEIYQNQPESESGASNRMEYRALEGFVFALSPFNFTAIAANLCSAPSLMGNVVVFKPSSTAVLSGYYLMKILKEAGLPDGVINFIPGNGSIVGETALSHKDLAGIHFTGSTGVFRFLWKKTGDNLHLYRSYPRIVGETGGKGYILMHPSADLDQVVTAAVRGAFDYQGQKCSACSRMYIPRSRWLEMEEAMRQSIGEITTGTVLDFRNFMNAVIDETAFDKITGFIERAQGSDRAKVIIGGVSDKSTGYFIEPTVILTDDPKYETMTEEIFGPVLTIYIYDDSGFENILEIVDDTSIYALTGAVFATDRSAISRATQRLVHSAGNFYINDKPTGAVVGQQPFGGARASGTNDKAGSMLNLLRWTSVRTIKENFLPPRSFKYPFMES